MIRDQIEQIRGLFEVSQGSPSDTDLIDRIVSGSGTESLEDAVSQVGSLAEQCLDQMDVLEKVYHTVSVLSGRCRNLTGLLEKTRDILQTMNESPEGMAEQVQHLISRIDSELAQSPELLESDTTSGAVSDKPRKKSNRSTGKYSPPESDHDDDFITETDIADTELKSSSKERKQALQNLFANRSRPIGMGKGNTDLFGDEVIFGKWNKKTNRRNEFNCEVAKERLAEMEYKAKKMADGRYEPDEDITEDLLDEIEDLEKDELPPTGNDLLDELDKIDALFIG